jgi:hypothetical protein
MSFLLLDEIDQRSSGHRGLATWFPVVLLVLTGASLQAQEARIGLDPGGAQEKPDRDAAKRLDEMRRSLGR